MKARCQLAGPVVRAEDRQETTHAALPGSRLAVVRLVVLPERSGVNLNDRVLDEGVCSDELVVGRVVDDAYQARLFGAVLGSPGKVARLEAERTVLDVAATGAHSVDAFGTELCHCRLATELKLSLLAVVRALGAGGRPV